MTGQDGQATLAPADGRDLMALESALMRVVRGVKANFARRPGRVDGAGYIVLACLEQRGQARLSDVAAILQLDTSTVSRQVRILEELGMVSRAPDPDDRRASRLTLNEAGLTELAQQRAGRHAVLQDALSSWSPADRLELLVLMTRLAEAVQRPRPADDAPDRMPPWPPRTGGAPTPLPHS